jgi:hypothetical protein
MAAYNLTGTVKVLMDTMKFDSGFTKREFVVTTEGDRFPQDVKFECVKDRCALLDTVKAGQRVTVSFDIRGNEYKGRYFVSLSAWKIESASDKNGANPANEDGPSIDQLTPPAEGSEEMPF